MKNSLIKYMASYSVTIKCSTMLLVNSKVLYRRKKQNLLEEECIGGAAGCQEGRWCSLHAAHPEMQDGGQYTRMVPKPHFFFFVNSMTLAQQIYSCGIGRPFTLST